MKKSNLFNFKGNISRNNHKLRRGFTLVDVLIGGIILGIGLCAMVGLFSHCSVLADTARELTIVMSAAQSKLEEIQSQDYNLIPGLYAQDGSIGNSFSLSQITGRGCIYIDESNPDLLEIEVVISWRRGRVGDITGED